MTFQRAFVGFYSMFHSGKFEERSAAPLPEHTQHASDTCMKSCQLSYMNYSDALIHQQDIGLLTYFVREVWMGVSLHFRVTNNIFVLL